jgi:hypothetical protein
MLALKDLSSLSVSYYLIQMNRRIAVFICTSDPACFNHALANALDFHEKGNEVIMVIEGTAVKNLKGFLMENNFYSRYFVKLRKAGLITPICHGCALKYDALEDIKRLGLTTKHGHSNPNDYRENGYEILTLVPRACNFCETWDDLPKQ